MLSWARNIPAGNVAVAVAVTGWLVVILVAGVNEEEKKKKAVTNNVVFTTDRYYGVSNMTYSLNTRYCHLLYVNFIAIDLCVIR